MLTIDYFQKSRNRVKVKILPAAVMFSEYYFYLIAYIAEDSAFMAQHFRLEKQYDFDEGELRERNQFIFPVRRSKSALSSGGHPCRRSRFSR